MNFSRTRNAPIAFPGVTHQGALGAPSLGTAARPRRGIQISLGSGARSSCESPGGPCWDLGRAAASSLLTPLSSEETGMKSHPVRGEPGQGAGESQVPRRPRRPERGEWQPGRAGARSASSRWSSRQAGLRATPPGSRRSLAEASGTECPRRRGPKRPSPSLAASPPCLGRSKQETQDLTWRDPDFWPGFPLSRQVFHQLRNVSRLKFQISRKGTKCQDISNMPFRFH
ncbi:uncharacterized protein LOC109460843 isoform X2 [Rhinolophus sinicus]|uniref:uncharacterized protein LOC109460843 isoform X2 n=1 Tax=Rhinolophus sinicus TaxID=89399 RepID=UPI003D7903C8